MSWRKKKKQINNAKHKVKLIIGLMFAVVIGLIVILGFKIFNKGSTFQIESRVENVKKIGKIENTDYEAIGWLRIEGTDIDFPVLYSENRNADFSVQMESFVWTRNSSKDFNSQINIVGHNIFNLSTHPKIKSESFHRFEQLMAFAYYDFAKENEYIQLTWGDKDYVYKIFAVGFVNTSTASFFNTYGNSELNRIKFEEDIVKEVSFYDYDVDVNENDKLISLSTCTRFDGSSGDIEFYVTGRLLRDGEKIEHYKVTKNKSNYNEIEKKLKGDEK
jgi:sortase B